MSYDLADYHTMKSRWKSGLHVGEAKPVMRGYVRTTRLKRDYETVGPDEIHATIPGLPDKIGERQVWKGRWHPVTGWEPLPNVLSFKDEHTFDANGVQTVSIEVENIAVIEESGLGGIFHTFQRGYYSPWRGYDPKGKRAPVGEQNEWYDVLADKSTQVIILGGYGDVVFPLFSGLVNDIDLESRPDRITLTARSVGQVPTDQNVFINAKVRHIKDPITFCDRLQADHVEEVAHGPDASDWQAGFNPTNIVDDDSSTRWRSDERDNAHPGDMPWLQIAVPNGRYEDFKLSPTWGGMACYVAIKARDANAPGGGAHRYVTGEEYADNEWIDEGNGNIPGTAIPYVKYIDSIKTGEIVHQLPDYGYSLGDDSIIRLYFTKLDYRLVKGTHRRAYFAGIDSFQALRRRVGEEAIRNDWILVDDLADVVKLVFQWCGINEYDVETTGVRLKDKAVFNRGNFLIDIIKAAADQVGYIYYFKPPESFDESPGALASTDPEGSMGIGVFRSNNSMRGSSQLPPGERVEEVRDDTLLDEPQARFTDEPLAYNIRVRGKQKKETKGGRTLGADDVARWMYVYRPPWSRDNDHRNANIKKYVVHHDNMLRSLDECKLAALFIAYREALEAATAVITFPCMPTIHLDHQIGVFDTGIGISSRIWIASRSVEFTGGPKTKFWMSIGGSLIDLPDISKVRKELVEAIGDDRYNPGLSHWEQTHYGDVYRGSDRG